MLPAIDHATGNLPLGMHEASWSEVIARFGRSPRQLVLLAGLAAALRNLEAAGCQRAYLDGSLVSEKADPGDTDTCWDVEDVVMAGSTTEARQATVSFSEGETIQCFPVLHQSERGGIWEGVADSRRLLWSSWPRKPHIAHAASCGRQAEVGMARRTALAPTGGVARRWYNPLARQSGICYTCSSHSAWIKLGMVRPFLVPLCKVHAGLSSA